ncbi:hypothetical protein Gotur_014791 [Gossypium turneri]
MRSRVETPLHAVRDCLVARNVWVKFVQSDKHLITGQASAGGLFRDHQGKWVTDYSRNIGVCSVLNAELWPIMDGLDIA